jgi:putative FmdB family regulatory protein
MAIYEYYCPTCKERFEERKPMSQASVATSCKAGHRAERMVSVFATPRSGDSSVALEDMPMGGGGCCGGGGCACGN